MDSNQDTDHDVQTEGITFDLKSRLKQCNLNSNNVRYLFENNVLGFPIDPKILREVDVTDHSQGLYNDLMSIPSTEKSDLKSNVVASFANYENIPTNVISLSNAASLILNDPHIAVYESLEKQMKIQGSSGIHEMEHKADEKNKILMLINDFKQLYTGKSFSSKTNNDRIKKFQLLENYFSGEKNPDWQLDDKGFLIYRSIKTLVKFSSYLDYFLKYPSDIEKGLKPPIFFEELFVKKILGLTSGKIQPSFHYTPDAHSKDHLRNGKKLLKKLIFLKKNQMKQLTKLNNIFIKLESKGHSVPDHLTAVKSRVRELHKRFLILQKESDRIDIKKLPKIQQEYPASLKSIINEVSKVYRIILKKIRALL